MLRKQILFFIVGVVDDPLIEGVKALLLRYPYLGFGSKLIDLLILYLRATTVQFASVVLRYQRIIKQSGSVGPAKGIESQQRRDDSCQIVGVLRMSSQECAVVNLLVEILDI